MLINQDNVEGLFICCRQAQPFQCLQATGGFLKVAVKRGELFFQYQPVVPVDGNGEDAFPANSLGNGAVGTGPSLLFFLFMEVLKILLIPQAYLGMFLCA